VSFKFNFLDSDIGSPIVPTAFEYYEVESPGRRFNFGRGPSIAEREARAGCSAAGPSISCIQGVSSEVRLATLTAMRKKGQRGSQNFHAHSDQRCASVIEFV
jgi:hypothetical protein